jgi:Ca2+-binding RTX toxin-like protein
LAIITQFQNDGFSANVTGALHAVTSLRIERPGATDFELRDSLSELRANVTGTGLTYGGGFPDRFLTGGQITGFTFRSEFFNQETGNLDTFTSLVMSDLSISATDFDRLFLGRPGNSLDAGQQIAILALAGADQFNGSSGSDNQVGFAGDDTFFGGAGNDLQVGDDGDDQIFGGAGNEFSFGGAGNDVFAGVAGNDVYFGGAGNDTAFGGAGNDNFLDESGNNSLLGDAGDDIIEGGSGIDRIDGGTGNDRLTGGAGADVLRAGTGNDTLSGGRGNDVMTGDAGQDSLSGGGGRDRLTGGAGADRLSGGGGRDSFVFDVLPGRASDADDILRFNKGKDKLVFDQDIFADIGPVGALDADAFVLGKAAKDAEDRVIYDKRSGNLFYDQDGRGGTDAILIAHILNGRGNPGVVLNLGNFEIQD